VSSLQDRLELSSLTGLHWLAVALALLSGAIHLLYFIGPMDAGLGFLGISFLLATGGYVGAVVLFFLEYRRRLLYLLGVPYTGSQIVIWLGYVLTGKLTVDVYAMVDKPAQLALIAVVIILYTRES
jgi:hypothetical protein